MRSKCKYCQLELNGKDIFNVITEPYTRMRGRNVEDTVKPKYYGIIVLVKNLQRYISNFQDDDL